jgi:hypothetical protein
MLSIACYLLATRQHHFDDRARKYIPQPYLINGGTFAANDTIFDKKTPQGNLPKICSF